MFSISTFSISPNTVLVSPFSPGCICRLQNKDMEHLVDDSRGVGENQSKQDDEVSRREELKKSVIAKLVLRQSNLNPERPDSSALRTLDSSIKRSTTVIKKLKQINEEQRESLMDELKNVCSLLHQRYKDFSPTLVQGLMKTFFSGKCAEDLDIDGNLRAIKKRSALKLLLELFFDGVIEDTGNFITIIKDLASLEHLKDRGTAHTNLSLLVSFARQASFLRGLISRQTRRKPFKRRSIRIMMLQLNYFGLNTLDWISLMAMAKSVLLPQYHLRISMISGNTTTTATTTYFFPSSANPNSATDDDKFF